MSRSDVRFAVGPSTSPKAAIIVFAIVGMGFAFMGDSLSDLTRSGIMFNIALLSFAAGGVVWLLDSWMPWLARWFTAVALVLLSVLTNTWLRAPGTLSLMVVPVVLVVALCREGVLCLMMQSGWV